MFEPPFKVDFAEDMKIALKSEMQSWGYKFDLQKEQEAEDRRQPDPKLRKTIVHDLTEMASRYMSIQHRMVQPRPRVVHLAPGFQAPISPKVKAGYDLLIDKVKRGEDLNPHLSSNTHFDAAFNDMLLNDWGIHHFHLGTIVKKKTGLIKRSGELVFAIVEPDDFYLVAVGDHDSFPSRRLFEITLAHWPQFFADTAMFAGRDEHGNVRTQTDDELDQLRNAGVFVFQPGPDGRLYIPKRGAYATSGRSTVVSRRAVAFMQRVAKVQMTFTLATPLILRKAAAASISPSAYEFHLTQSEDGRFVAVDHATATKVWLEGRSTPIS